MGLFSNLAKAGLAKKAFDVARKPENQAKAKGAFASARGKAMARRGGAPRSGGAAAGRAGRGRMLRRSGAPRR